MCLNVFYSFFFFLQISFHFSDTLFVLSMRKKKKEAEDRIWPSLKISELMFCVCWELRELTQDSRECVCVCVCVCAEQMARLQGEGRRSASTSK